MMMLSLIGLTLYAQVRPKVYNVPKYPLKSGVTQLHEGTWPGSAVPEGAEPTSDFKRVEYFPTALRLLVRAECSTTIGQQELIEKAKSITTDDGGVVQIDWGRVSSDKVTFYGVFYSRTRTTDVKLTAKDGKYMIASHTINDSPVWQARRVSIRKLQGACIDEKEMTERDLKLAIFNMLSQMSGDTRRNRNIQ